MLDFGFGGSWRGLREDLGVKVAGWGWGLVFGARVTFFYGLGFAVGCYGLLLGFVLRIGYRVRLWGSIAGMEKCKIVAGCLKPAKKRRETSAE